MRTFALVVTFVFAAGCSDMVTERYASYEDARRAGLFERGWLPDVLPTSAHSIEARNDLDLNVAAGEFFVANKDLERFVERLESYSGEPLSADVHLAAYLDAKEKEGLCVGVLRESSSLWAFVCDQRSSRCTYTLAPER